MTRQENETGATATSYITVCMKDLNEGVRADEYTLCPVCRSGLVSSGYAFTLQHSPCLLREQLRPHVLDVRACADGEQHDSQERPKVKERAHRAQSLRPAGHLYMGYTFV